MVFRMVLGGVVLSGFVLLGAGLVLVVWGLAAMRGEGRKSGYGKYPLIIGLLLILAAAYLFSLFFRAFG